MRESSRRRTRSGDIEHRLRSHELSTFPRTPVSYCCIAVCQFSTGRGSSYPPHLSTFRGQRQEEGALTFAELTAYLDRHLRLDEVPDYPDAQNGVQIERDGDTDIARVAFAVDTAEATILEAARKGADLLVVHHGLFWGGVKPLTGAHYRRVRGLIASNVGLYSAHLPLDVHPHHGNNAVLAGELGVNVEGTFGDYRGLEVGVWGNLDIRREALAARLDQVLGNRVRLIPGGPERVHRIGIVTGGGGSQIGAARAAALDAFITGEVAHHNYFDATEGGINLYLGGHYATEVWGLRALAGHIGETFGLETFFVDHPTGL